MVKVSLVQRGCRVQFKLTPMASLELTTHGLSKGAQMSLGWKITWVPLKKCETLRLKPVIDSGPVTGSRSKYGLNDCRKD